MKAKRSERMPRRYFVYAGIVVCLVVLGIIGYGVSRLAGETMWPVDTIEVEGQEAREALETLWGAPLPASANDFHYHAYGFQDVIGFGRFTLPASEWEKTFAAITRCFDSVRESESVSNGFSNDQINKSWWTPEAGQRFITTIQCQGNNSVFYHLTVDITDPDTYLVYVYAFTT